MILISSSLSKGLATLEDILAYRIPVVSVFLFYLLIKRINKAAISTFCKYITYINIYLFIFIFVTDIYYI